MARAAQSSEADDATLRRFLLGQVGEEERERLELRCFEDDDWFERLLTVEEALIDVYLRGQLRRDERDRFERRYLGTAGGRQRIAVARAVAARSRWWPRESWFRAWFTAGSGAPRSRWSIGVAAATALALLAGGTWAWNYERDLRRQLEDATARLAVQELRERELVRQLEAQQEPAGPVVALALYPGLVRDSQAAAHLRLPRDTSLLVLHLHQESAGPASTYRALVRTVDGSEIWRQEISVPQPLARGQPLAVALPARVVGPDEYLVTLQTADAGGRLVDLATYYFRIDESR